MIKIKPSHKGLLHKNLGVAKGKKLTVAQEEKAKSSKSPAVRKRATFALNARSWNHSNPLRKRS
jgi:oligoendopeptidase F